MGLPVSGDSLAFFTASWNFLSRSSEACFCASTDCRKIDSRRLSCSFMARAASSISLNIRGFTAAVWAITAAVAVSTLSSALQQGQVTSIVAGLFAIVRMIPQNWTETRVRFKLARFKTESRSAVKFDREDVEHAQQLPAQQKDRKKDYEHRHQFSEGETTAVRLEAPRGKAQDIQRGEPEDDGPENVVNVAPAVERAHQ